MQSDICFTVNTNKNRKESRMKIDPTIVTFALYLILMLGIGAIFCKKIKTTTEYFLGGRGLGSWVTALSAQASDMSGWLLMGLPGAIYMAGLGDSWVAIGLGIGTILNWILIAPRLRIYTEKADALTLSSFFAIRFREKTNLIRLISSIVILIFFTIYAASALVAAGKLFNNIFSMNYKHAVLLGATVVLLYTLLGGYLAVCWTDLVQGMLMFIALVAVPIAAYMNLGSAPGTIMGDAGSQIFSLMPKADNGWLSLMAIVSCAVWGLGYCGQPHILTRFMSIKSFRLLPRSTTIATIWVVISLAAAVVIGLLARAFFLGLNAGNSENVFIYLIQKHFNPWFGGIFLAAILAAIMSTIDSQLLVSSSALTEDIYKRLFRKNASIKEQVTVSRISVLVITLIATMLALLPNQTIFSIVKFAWGGFGAAFGPVVIMALYSRKTTWISALVGIIVGAGVMVTWYALGLGKYMYEILPGFIAGWLAIVIVNAFMPQQNAVILKEYDDMLKELHSEKEINKEEAGK